MHVRTPTFAAAVFLLAASSHADSITLAGNRCDGAIIGIKDGKLAITINTTEQLFDLNKIQSMDLDAAPKLAVAEAERAGNPLDASQLYEQVLNAINDPQVRALVELRAVEPFEKNNQFDRAVALFLDVYQSHPDDAVWQFRPKQLPAQGSRFLTTAAAAVSAAVKSAKTVEARHNLRLFLLDIYNRAGDTDAAARLANLIKTGIPEDASVQSTGASPQLSATLTQIDTQLKAKNFAVALQSADAALQAVPPPPADAAVDLFSQKARALEGLNKPEDAAAAWLRIPAHFPTSPAVPAALLHAATLQKSLHHEPSAAALMLELKSKYPTSPEAAAAK